MRRQGSNKPFKLQLRMLYTEGGQTGQVSFEVSSLLHDLGIHACWRAARATLRCGAGWTVKMVEAEEQMSEWWKQMSGNLQRQSRTGGRRTPSLITTPIPSPLIPKP